MAQKQKSVMIIKDVIKIFDELKAKGYSVEEIVNMPIVVGKK